VRHALVVATEAALALLHGVAGDAHHALDDVDVVVGAVDDDVVAELRFAPGEHRS